MLYQLLQLNNQYYETDGLIDATTANQTPPTYINNATGTIKVQDPSGANLILDGISAQSLPLNYVAASNGVYRALLTSLNTLSSNQPAPIGPGYTIVIDLQNPGGAVYHRELVAAIIVGRAG